jgi:XTP/dITP diphosphohydrolase
MTVDLLFATTNPGKLRELRRLVSGLPVRVLSLTDLERALHEVTEDGATFRENAEKKAAAYARESGLFALADDSGLCVDALDGAPGVFSARWSAEGAGLDLPRAARDEANNEKLLAELEGVPDDRRGAEYRAVLSLARPDGQVLASVEGVCRGRIGHERRGAEGFGYDPLFVVEGPTGRTMAELSAEEKDAISHRGRAFREILPIIRSLGHPGVGSRVGP